jgi:alpha-tubulin suppressor-like RCC1 family protein
MVFSDGSRQYKQEKTLMNSLRGLLIYFYATWFAFLLGCSAQPGPTNSSAASDISREEEFSGAERIFANDDGTWTVWWKPVYGATDVRYYIYQRNAATEPDYDFSTPTATTSENTYTSADLRLTGNTCYVVRFFQNSEVGPNSRELCTNHQPWVFEGIDQLVSLRDGSYMLKWRAPPFKGAQFQIFQKITSEGAWQPHTLTEDNFFKTGKISLDEVRCFRVRYVIDRFPEDVNVAERCSTSIQNTGFNGVSQLESPGRGQLRVRWTPSDRPEVAGYHVYLGNDFKQKIADLKGLDRSEFTVNELLHGVVYTIGVRAYDIYGREDENTKVISYELENHRPVVKSVVTQILEVDGHGRPVKLQCSANYEDEDSWQTLKPTFQIKNNKKNGLGIVERQTTVGSANQKSVVYTLLNDDKRADQLNCYVTVSDGFHESLPKLATPVPVSDTPVIATGLFLEAKENTEMDIVITRGAGIGYVDFDQDDATAIQATATNGIISSPLGFTCAEATCTARFKPAKDFFTNSDSSTPTYATIQYRVTAGDSTSNTALINLAVRPVPRALGFDMIAQQDQNRTGDIAASTITAANGEITQFAGYTHVLGHQPSKIYLRHPLEQGNYHGKISLPSTVGTDLANDVGCRTVPVQGWSSDGFECAIPCFGGKCPFVFKGDLGYYGQAAFDYAVVIDGILSNYATARVEILPFLQATGFNGLTVEGRNFTIKMAENQGFKGAGNGLRVTAIQPFNIDGIDPTMTFAVNASNEWVATATPNAGFNGIATFDYKIVGINENTGLVVESNVSRAQVHFYPYPVATGISEQAIEDRGKLLVFRQAVNLSSKDGYYHRYLDQAKGISISDIQLSRGFVSDFGSTVSSGDLACNGICNVAFNPASGYYDLNAATHLKFKYRIKTEINSSLFSTAGIVIDPYLAVVANRTLYSAEANGNIEVRPIPRANTMQFYVAENTAEKPSQLSLLLSSGTAPTAYSHVLGLKATEIDVTGATSQGTLGLFTCAPSGDCSASFVPNRSLIGQINPPIGYAVKVYDPQYRYDAGKISSEPSQIKVDIRPLPKTVDLTRAIPESTSFAPSSLALSFGLDAGYTHAYGYLANSLTIAEALPQKGLLSTNTCSAGLCTSAFTPTPNFYGTTSFTYSVSVNDPYLGSLSSAVKAIALDVRPRPRTVDLGTSAPGDRIRVVENTASTVTFELGQQYTHAYGFKAVRIDILTADHYAELPAGACDASGKCTVSFNPAPDYEGNAQLTYRIAVQDPVLNSAIESNVSTVYLDVYPKPKASRKEAYAIQNSTSTLEIDLRQGRVLNEDSFALGARKGYTHRRDDPADSVVTSNLTRGSLTAFTCSAAGRCTANYTATAYDPAINDSFDFKVKVNGVESNTEKFFIKIRPAAFAYDLNKITVEGQPLILNFPRQLNLGYTHPLNTNASRIEVMTATHGNAVVDDLDAGASTQTCDASGGCQITFTPESGYSTPDADLANAFFTYRVWTYDNDIGAEIPSNTAKVVINVRPKPKAVSASIVALQGATVPVSLARAAHYSYAANGGTISSIAAVNGSATNGTLTSNSVTCNGAGLCGPFTFNPTIMNDGRPFYGSAKFDFKAVVFDSYLNGNIESNVATLTIDVRPLPIAQSKHFKLWQTKNILLNFGPGEGYTHPYYADNPNQYRATKLILTQAPSDGTLTASNGQFACNASTKVCAETFTPDPLYFYNGTNYLKFKYKIGVVDPAYGYIESEEAESTIEVKPAITNLGRTVKGVEAVDKPLALQKDKGYSYPLAALPSAPIITIQNPSNGNLLAPFSCSASVCSSTFRTSTSSVTGAAGFDYKLTLNDPDIGPFDTPYKRYDIDFYPTPKAEAFTFPGSSFTGDEGTAQTIRLLPGNFATNALCHANHQPLAPKLAYTHKNCDPAVEVLVDPSGQTNGAFLSSPAFSCASDGLCSGSFTPNDPTGTWLGFGVAQFNYRVRINPLALQSEDLTAQEIAGLTSGPASVQVEYRPLPWATGLTLQAIDPALDYIYAVQGASRSIEVSRCNTPTLRTDCHTGYTHGYDHDATQAQVSAATNVNLNPFTCAAGICTSLLTPASGYFSASSNDFASFNYKVTVDGQASAFKTVKVQVYPTPIAQQKLSEGLENDDVTLTIAYGNGYTHPYNQAAVKVNIVVPPDEIKGSFVNPANSAQLLTPGVHDLDNAFVCTSGTCIATYRPQAGVGGINSFWFRVKVSGPTGMATTLKDQLISEQKQYSIKIHPKPVATKLELAVLENSEPNAFNFTLNRGFTHEFSAPATSIDFLNAQLLSANKVQVNTTTDRGTAQGLFTCLAGECSMSCSSGNCGGVFTPKAGVYSNTTQTLFGCEAAGANCPSLTYKATVRTEGGLLAQSQNTGTLRFNVRPVPRASGSPVSLVAAEGDSVNIRLKNNAGYSHPFYGATSAAKTAVANGDISSSFACATVGGEEGVCDATFIPSAAWHPTSLDKFASVSYKVTVVDPTVKDPGSGNLATVGSIQSSDVGTVQIEYRPRPVPTVVSSKIVQDTASVQTININAGYTHEYNLKATKLIIPPNSQSHLEVDGCTYSTGCEIACVNGLCSVSYVPQAGYSGTASFLYEVVVSDSAFTPAKDLKSLTTGTATIDVRPKPTANNLTLVSAFETPIVIKLMPSSGYSHPLSYKAKSITLTTPVANGAITSPFVCDTLVGSPGYGTCTGTLTPSNSFFGDSTFSYFVTVNDPVLGADINSLPATVTVKVRPKPVATGLVSTFTTWENSNRTLVIANGPLVAKAGYYYPNAVDPQYDVQPSAILIDSALSTIGSLGAFTCSTGAAPNACQSLLTVQNNVYGASSFTYRVRIQDSVLGQNVDSNPASIDVDVRPIIRAYDTTYTNNVSLKAVENTNLSWQISNSAPQGYTYPTQASYASVLSTLGITAIDDPAGNGTNPTAATCSAGVCSGTFVPTNNFNGTAKFKFQLSIQDNALPAADKVYTSQVKTATIDVYPRPVANNRTFYTVQNQAVAVSVAKGAGLGYTHLRADNLSSLTVSNPLQAVNFTTSSFNCSAGTCSGTFTPANGFYSPSSSLSDAAGFDYSVSVTETGSSPRTAASSNLGHASVIVYPYSVPSAGATLVNIPAWEGEAAAFTLKSGAGLGYTHPWGDLAKDISLVSLTSGSTSTAITCDVSGDCSGTVTPKLGTYGNGAVTLVYKTNTQYAPLAPASTTVQSSQSANVTFNVRAVPKVSASLTKTGIENSPLTGQTISLNSGYTYGDSANRSISKIELRNYQGTYNHITCDGGCGVYDCASGICPIPQLNPEANWDRTDGLSRLEYRVMVRDESFGSSGADKWSGWGTLNIDLLPQGKGTTVEYANGIESTNFPLSVSLNQGYTHVEAVKATKLEILSSINLSGLTNNSTIDCVNGVCDLNLVPITTTFNAVTGKTTTGGSYGWAEVRYRVLNPIASNSIWSTEGRALVYFRPVPKPDDVTVTNAIEGQALDVVIRLKGSGGCVSGCGYSHPGNLLATAISVSGATGVVESPAPSCVAATGVCTVRFSNPTAATKTFAYKVTVDGLAQVVSGLATVTFLPRPRTENLTLNTFEGTSVDVVMNRGAGLGYTHADNHNAQDTALSSISNGTVQQVVGGVAQTCSDVGGRKICLCNTGTAVCTVRFLARMWSSLTEIGLAGGFQFKSRDALYKEANGTDPLESLNTSTVTIGIRPTVKPSDTSYSSNTYLKAIENTPLNWQIANGVGLGYQYPTDAAYTSVLSTLSITASTDGTSNGTLSAGASCLAGVCSGTFTPDANITGSANFKYTLGITDASLPAGSQSFTSPQKTATIDIYPRPVANPTLFYGVQGQSVNVTLSKGASLGYTHARNDAITSVVVSANSNSPGVASASFVCTAGTCTAPYSAEPTYYSASNTNGAAATFDYQVKVTETGTAPRTAQSTNTSVGRVIVYPRPIPDVGASLTNISAWEGESSVLTISRGVGLGYTHPWNDPAKSLSIQSVSAGSTASTFACDLSGTCTSNFVPKSGVFGNGAASLSYKVNTEFLSLATPAVASATAGTVTYNVRATPKVPAALSFVGIENTPLTGKIIGLNSGYTYGDSANRFANTLELRPYGGTIDHVNCSGGCAQYNGISGQFTLPGLVPETDWDRTDGLARLEYRVRIYDEGFGPSGMEKWSGWQTINLSLLPMARGKEVEFPLGIEGRPYALSLSLNNGYTHVESALATKIEITGFKNLDGLTVGTQTNCTAGVCNLTLNPIATTFDQVTGKTATGGAYGWAELKYKVLVPVSGVDIMSTEGRALVYFRPTVKAQNVVVANAIEDTPFDVKIRLAGTGGCASGCGYTHVDNHLASSIVVSNPTATVQGTPACDATGVCTVRFYSTLPGTYAFNYKVTVDTIEQQSVGTATVTFLARARNENLTASTIEGSPIDIVIDRGPGLGYTQADNNRAQDVVLSSITTGSVEQLINGVTPSACSVSGSNTICSCRTGTDQCIIRYTPRSWNDGESTLSGGFTFRTRDAIYREADGVTPLAAKTAAQVTIALAPRVVANSRTYPEGSQEGVEGLTKTVSIASGTGGTSAGGYRHALSYPASKIEILSMSKITITGCPAVGCQLTCAAGVCSVPAVPLSGASFDKNGGFTYRVYDADGFSSHVPGVASVFFYPRAKPSNKSIVVEKGVTSSLTMGLNDGYSHLLSYNASAWSAVNQSNLNGTLSGFVCDSVNCRVDYVPNTGYYSNSSSDTSSFTFDVTHAATSGNVTSSTTGTYTIEVFPRPVAQNKTLYWVNTFGDMTKAPADRRKITVALNDDYTHDRGYAPKAIDVSNISGGSFISPFACVGDICTAEFQPTAVSSNNTQVAAYFEYRVKVIGSYDAFPSNKGRINIINMPVPTVPTTPVVSTSQGNSLNFEFASSTSLVSIPIRVELFNHPWSIGPVAPADVVITQQPSLGASQVGTIQITGCSANRCVAQLTISDGSAIGDATFKYKVTVRDQSQAGWYATTPEATGTLQLTPYYQVTGRYFTGDQQLATDGNGNKSIVPITDVPIALGLNTGYTQASNQSDVGQVKILNSFASSGSIINASLSGGTWTATFRSAPNWFGDVYIQYQVCKTDCNNPADIKSRVEASQTKWIHVYINPNDIPPTACSKTGADSLIVYQDTAKAISLAKGSECANGIWYDDRNDGDQITSISFLNPQPPGSITGSAGTVCSTITGARNCVCAASSCDIVYTPPLASTGDYSVQYKVKTRSVLINQNTESAQAATLNLSVKTPLAPQAQNISATTGEDVAVTVALSAGSGYLTAQQIDASYPAEPDGYSMKASSAEVVSYDTSVLASAVMTGCTNGTCNISVTPRTDVAGTTAIVFNVTANGVKSTNKTISLTITPNDDKPNTYAQGLNDLGFNRTQDFNESWQRAEGTWYQNGVGDPVTLKLMPWTGHPQRDSIALSSATNKVYGYFDVDGDRATKVRIGAVTGGTINYDSGKNASDAFTCDASGVCTVSFTPNGSIVNNYASFQYWVTTTGTAGPVEQPMPSLFQIFVAGVDASPVAQHMPTAGTQDPSIADANYNVDYTIARAGKLNIILRRGTAYSKGQWRGFGYTDWAQRLEIGTGANGAPAPAGLTATATSFPCNNANCTVSLEALSNYNDFPAAASFWYRVIANESYSAFGYNFGSHITTTSAWKKVTVKVILNQGVGCTAVPDLDYDGHFVTRDAVQSQSTQITVGNGSSAGNGYNHSGTGSDWRPLQKIEIVRVDNGSISGLDCTTNPGKCTMTFNPSGVTSTPADRNDDFTGHWAVVRFKAVDDYGCPSAVRDWYVNIKPAVSTRNICEFNFETARDCFLAPNTLPNVATSSSTTLTFRKKGSLPVESFGSYEYETVDDGNATKVVLSNFDNPLLLKAVKSQSFSGPGVTCSEASGALVCETTNCDANGDCRFTFNSNGGTDWGPLTFKYKVYTGSVYSKNFWVRNPELRWPNGYNLDKKYWESGDATYTMYVKASPVVTNPSHYLVGANGTINLKIGKEDPALGVYGYTYADSAQFQGKDINITFSNPVNGSIQSSYFDTTTKLATLDFKPDLNFLGTATVNYMVSVWGVPSQTGTISINVIRYISTHDQLASTTQNTMLNGSLNIGADYDYVLPYGYKASTMEIATSTYQASIPTSEGAFSNILCDAAGLCTYGYTPPTGFLGTKHFKFRLASGPAAAKVWTPWYDLTIDVIGAPSPPVVYPMSLTGIEGESKPIVFSRGATVADGPASGYTDPNQDAATQLLISNPVNGSVTPNSPVSCVNGLCIVSFTPAPSYYGDATFQFNVVANGDQAVSPALVTVNFDAKLRATPITLNGVKNTPRPVTIALNSGYTYGPGALVTDVVVSNITPSGSSVSAPSCAAGLCSMTLTPAQDLVGTTTFDFKVQIKSGSTLVKESNVATVSLALSGEDTAPVAINQTRIMADRNPLDISLVQGPGYTDAEGDKATALRIDSSNGLQAVTNQACDSSGTCTLTLNPSPGFSGTASLNFSVQAGGLWSNSARIKVTVPDDPSSSFNLQWSGAATLDYQCKIQVPGAINVLTGIDECGSATCSSYTATLDPAFTSSGVTAGALGVQGIYNKYAKTGDMFVSWTVANQSSESHTLGRFLTVSSAPPKTVRQALVSLTATPEMTTEGMQMLAGGCTGTSCSSNRIGSLASGRNFSCALLANSGVQCWGENSHGKLGINDLGMATSSAPRNVKDPLDPDYDLTGATAIVAGSDHACALLSNRRVVCWGDNTYGQLGFNDTNAPISEQPYPNFVTTNVSGSILTNITGLSAGSHHTCAVNSARNVFCWGRNSEGQLGNGTTDNALWARPVLKVLAKSGDSVTSTGNLDQVFSVSAGADHTCALRLDVASGSITGKHAVCWGSNAMHQIGDNNYLASDVNELSKVGPGTLADDRRLYPAKVRDSSSAPVGDISQLVAFYQGSCLLKSSGNAMCWGSNSFGQLGIGEADTNAVVNNPTLVKDAAGVSVLGNVASLSARFHHICALGSDRKASCWGRAGRGALGDGTSLNRSLPVSVSASGGTGALDNVLALSVGSDHSCALVSGGLVLCWGDNTEGELGITLTTDRKLSPSNGVTDADDNVLTYTARECSLEYKLP